MAEVTNVYAKLSQAVYKGDKSSVDINGVKYTRQYVKSDSSSGFYGAIYKDEQTGELIVAFRGTEFDDDFVHDLLETDGGMVVSQVNQQVAAARQLVEEAKDMARELGGDDGPVSISLTGHSLGGTLAQIMSYEFNLYGEAFNAYGAVGLEDVPSSGDIPAGHANFVNYVRATDIIAAASPQYGQVKLYATETDTHLPLMTANDSAAWISEVLTTPNLSVSATHGIDYFLGDNSILTEANHQRYESSHLAYDIFRSEVQTEASAFGDNLSQNQLIDWFFLSHYKDHQLVDVYLNKHQQDASGSEAAFIRGTPGSDTLQGSPGSDWIIGGGDNDVLRGSAGKDELYGDQGDDYLEGGKGNDVLVGGAGSDRYNFNHLGDTDNDTDIVIDSDGQGQIEIAANVLSIGERLSVTTWASLDGNYIISANLSLDSQTLIIKNKDTGSKVLVKNWHNGDLSIQLGGDIPAPLVASLTADNDLFGEGGIVGLNGFRAIDSYDDYGVYAQFARYPGLKARFEEPRIQGNWIHKNWLERLGVTGSNSGDDAYAGLGGSDGLGGGAGNDTLKGGANNDLILGGSGDDRLYGSDGIDYIIDGSSETHFGGGIVA